MAQAVFTWAMAANRFLRHPGYAANIVTMFAVPLLAKTTGVFHYRLGKGAR